MTCDRESAANLSTSRHTQRRRVLISRGRDAVDAALTTIYGPSRLAGFKVWADQVADDYHLPQ